MRLGDKRKRDDLASDSDGQSSEDDFDFENIDLTTASGVRSAIVHDQDNGPQSIQIDLKESSELKQRVPRAAIARKLRYEIHKTHLLCLLSHAAIRHYWSLEPEVIRALERIKGKIKGTIHPKTTSAQLQRTRVLLKSLESICDVWSTSFKITSGSLTKAKWYTDSDMIDRAMANSKLFMDHAIKKAHFIVAAQNLEGDRDIGAQLFISFLRLLGFETRLICSLQPLSLTAAKTDLSDVSSEIAPIPSRVVSSPDLPPPVQRPRKISRPQFGAPVVRSAVIRPKVLVGSETLPEDCKYPVYWAEVFDPAAQKWYSVDPLVTGGVNRPSMFEPPQSEDRIALSYVIAFDKDGSAKDVTHRYTNQYNAKVRRNRLESISDSADRWWKRCMKYYRPQISRDREAIEDAELAQKSLTEGIPANVSDLKNHPLFVIERHLRKNEIISPLRECGTIRIGKSQPVISEKVYPRKYVKTLRSKLSWYLRGRLVKDDQVPLKTIIRKSATKFIDADEPEDINQAEDLYSEDQTAVFIPEPVTNGFVPKNSYGNVDLFLPSMLPPGSTHFAQRDAEGAAKLLGIDCAVAVVGFDHSNRQTLPVKQGVVVASEYATAMLEILGAMQDAHTLETERRTSLAALERWNRFLRALRIREHVESRYNTDDAKRDNSQADASIDPGGGFL